MSNISTKLVWPTSELDKVNITTSHGTSQGSKYILRQLRVADIPILVKLERCCFSTAWEEEQFRMVFSTSTFLAVGLQDIESDHLIGYISMYHFEDTLEILNIAVLSDFRCHGLGSRLLEFAIQTARHFGIVQVVLEVRPSNYPALALYRRFGFSQTGIRSGYYTDTGEDALVYAVNLDTGESVL